MSSLQFQFTPLQHALRAALFGCSLMLAASPSLALAEGARVTSEKQRYQLAPGPLGHVLAEFAALTGTRLSFDPALVANAKSEGLQGYYTVNEGFDTLLKGSEFALEDKGGQQYSLKKIAKVGSRATPAVQEVIDTLSDVTVKGEKIERKLSETFSSVAVATDQDIRTHADQSLTEILARTPGVYTQSRNETWGIRGVPVTGFDDQGPLSLNNAVSVFVDGALQTSSMVTLSPLSTWDMKQVEVYRGAQSTVQGRNALAGAVIMQTNDPEFKNAMTLQGNLGNYYQQGGALAANAVLVPDVLAGRFALNVQNEDGYIKNSFLDNNADPRRSINARGKLLLLAGEKTEALLTLSHTDYSSGSNGVTQINNQPQYYRLIQNTDAKDSIQQNEATLKLTYQVSQPWVLTSITSGTDANYQSLLDFDQRTNASQEADRHHQTRLFSQEFRATYQGEAIKAHAGIYYGYSRVKFNDSLRIVGLGDVLQSIGRSQIRNNAIFGEINWDMDEHWQAIAGLRYDHEKNIAKVDYPLDILAFSPVTQADEQKSFGALLPKAGINYIWSPTQRGGFVVQRGYRGGGVNMRVPSDHRPYDAEFTTTYEFSYRGSWPEYGLKTFANLYYTDWKDQQVRQYDAVTDSLYVSNAARSRMRGLEVSAEYAINSEWQAIAGAAYNHTEYLDFINSDGLNMRGKQFTMAPRTKVNLGLNYHLGNQWLFNVDTVYQSSSPSVYLLTETRRNDSVVLVNANASYRLNPRTTVNAFVRNLFDREYVTNNSTGDVLDVGAPRLFGVALKLEI
ncbi:Outer membrane receptor proteins, mostly Fe transport [Methylophilus rhizosphaerae]|uniref:Outer membrane receptor proteins, mostly Fe transport n=1 Tax=Methylophilus rhizosphaerae TaxID=492660 RepID=A0A1G9BND0_9PROT|nr:TonB-dependent receptor [Methylophilus rhizosphaerae]SDK40976.1 Outer membrane receptor proteins, mostly Fe transport [Methylophilus rhizosphaerae]